MSKYIIDIKITKNVKATIPIILNIYLIFTFLIFTRDRKFIPHITSTIIVINTQSFTMSSYVFSNHSFICFLIYDNVIHYINLSHYKRYNRFLYIFCREYNLIQPYRLKKHPCYHTSQYNLHHLD